jgi:galactokinase
MLGAMSSASQARPDTAGLDLNQALRGHVHAFEQRRGRGEGVRLFYAPGRVNLMGAHLDYNGGPVMPMAIDRGTFLCLRRRTDGILTIASTAQEPELSCDLEDLPEARAGLWYDYPLGVLRELLAMRRGEPCGLDALFGGNLAVGAGLSSSASICIVTALGIGELWGLDLSARDRVQVALRAEREFVGVQCGIMDPFAIGLARAGSILWLDCKDATVQYLPFRHADYTVAVADSLVRRELAQGEFNARVRECQAAFEKLRRRHPRASCLRDIPPDALSERDLGLDPVEELRARHVLEEVGRTIAAREALERGDMRAFGACMLAAHASLRDLYEVSVAELDCLVEAASSCDGVFGARLTGAGFGGCAVAVLSKGAEQAFAESVTNAFASRFGKRPAVAFYSGDSGPREVEL